MGTLSVFGAVNDRGVRVVERGEEFRLSLESGDRVRVHGETPPAGSYGDVAIEPRVECPIHFTHAAGAEGGDNRVRAKARAGNEGQTLLVDYTGGAAARRGYSCSTPQGPSSSVEPVEIRFATSQESRPIQMDPVSALCCMAVRTGADGVRTRRPNVTKVFGSCMTIAEKGAL